MDAAIKIQFSKLLISWYKENARDLPWRETRDPYLIWVSEIILQQTRIDQGLPYYLKFATVFPTVQDLARADLDYVLSLWQGLGYYSRARNMHKAAKMVVEDFHGAFPATYSELIKLPGVGDYTASAISSIVIQEGNAVVDGNVFRVLARVFDIDTPIDTTLGKRQFKELAQELLDEKHPGKYNQALMDFGSVHCKAKGPLCVSCMFNESCMAYRLNKVDVLPKKQGKQKIRNRYFHYFIIKSKKGLLMYQRHHDDVWQGLFEFPVLETKEELSLEELTQLDAFKACFGDRNPLLLEGNIKHVLSHQRIFANFYILGGEVEPDILEKYQWRYYNSEKIAKLAKHKLIFSFLEKHRLL